MIAKSVLLAGSFVAFSLVATAGDAGFTGAVFADQAKNVGSAAAADLGNEILSRIDSGKNPDLKRLISTEEKTAELRAKCGEAVAKLIEQEKHEIRWQTGSLPKGEKKAIVGSIERDFALDLGSGLEWKQKVMVSWLISDVSVDNIKPPVRSRIWISFELPTLPALGGPDLKIGGGGQMRTDFIAIN